MNKYNKIAELIFDDLRSRGGFDIDICDEAFLDIIETWAKLIEENV